MVLEQANVCCPLGKGKAVLTALDGQTTDYFSVAVEGLEVV